MARIDAGLLPASAGAVRFAPSGSNAKLARQMIFQDPSASLNPRLRVLDQVAEAAVAHGLVKTGEMRSYADAFLAQIGLDASATSRFPLQFSDGQRARIGMARAFAVKPELLVCDASVAAIDVTIDAQMWNLFCRIHSLARLDIIAYWS